MKKYIAVLLALITITSTGCSLITEGKIENKYTIKAKELSSPVDKISEANNKVAFKFLNEMVNTHKNENVVISPLSLNTVLSLTQNGAAGKTKEEMLQSLEMKGLDDRMINESYQSVIAHYNSLKSIEIKMGNSIWMNKGLQVREDFKSIGRNFYEAEISTVDFSKNSATETINKWISKQTAGNIKKIVDSFDKNTAMALINTVYFKGKWSKSFNEKNTSKQKFTSSDNSVKEVDMMKEQLSVDYLKGEDFQAIRLPYEDSNFGMYIFLPDKEKSIDNILGDMSFDNWNRWMNKFTRKEAQVHLPKFKIEFEAELNEMLETFGMGSAFTDEADFTKISDKHSLYIDLVKQKCYIDVDEAGTEAAAVTVVTMKETSAAIDKPIDFKADRPFIYAIADKKTGMLLFIGKVEKP
jgi:serine protease inhibitor